MNVNIHIERLILDGLAVAHADRPALQAAVEGELARLLAEGGVAEGWQTGGAVSAVPAAPIQLRPDARPAELGGQIARSVYGGIGGKS